MHLHHPKIALYALPDTTSGTPPFSVDPILPGSDATLPAPREESLAKIADQIPALLWLADPKLRFTSAFGSGWNLLQDRPFPGMALDEFFALGHADDPLLVAHRCALGGLAQHVDFVIEGRRFFGTVEPLFGEGGELAGTVSVVLDATALARSLQDRWDLTAAVLETKKNQALKNLAGGIAHNFNNLLTVIVGYAALAQSMVPDDSPLKSMVQEIEAAANIAADIVGQLSLYVQKTPFRPEKVNLSSLIEKLEPRWHGYLHGIDLKLDLAERLPAIEGDATHLERLVQSLLLNAWEAIGESRGTITVRTQAIEVNPLFLADTFIQEPLPSGDYIWLQVSDTGRGMDDETKAHLFEPFYSTKFTGRGLGLAAARGIAHQHKGAISVSSKPGLGSTFHVVFPCVQESQGS